MNLCPKLRVCKAASPMGLLLRLKTPFSGRVGGPGGGCCRRCLYAWSFLLRFWARLDRPGRLGGAVQAVADVWPAAEKQVLAFCLQTCYGCLQLACVS